MSIELRGSGESYVVVDDVFAKFDTSFIYGLSCNEHIRAGKRYSLKWEILNYFTYRELSCKGENAYEIQRAQSYIGMYGITRFKFSEKSVEFSSYFFPRHSNKGCKYPKVDIMTILTIMMITILIVIILCVGVILFRRYVKNRNSDKQENNSTTLLIFPVFLEQNISFINISWQKTSS